MALTSDGCTIELRQKARGMTAAHPDPVVWEEQRAELQAVLESEEFTRAPTLARLLSYLCEKVFCGEADTIKEYSLGVEVFHRESSFDQDSDSIVRVEANRLRKRLARYYAGSGVHDRLQITIPIGQYVPKFERALSRPETVLIGAKPTSTSGVRVQWLEGWHHPARWLAAILGIVLVATGGTWLLLRQGKPASPTVPVSATPAEASSEQIGPPPGEEIRILAGSDRSLVDHAGKLWNHDACYRGGISVRGGAEHIWRTQDPAFYRNSRQGQFSYDIPLKKDIYELRLHFAEMTFGAEASALGGEGSRLMTVRANGRILLTDFDVVADAGASRTADVKVFTNIEPASDGMLHLEFAGDSGKQAMVSAIELVPGIGHQVRPVRIVTRQSPYYSNDSHWWSPDDYFEGGQLATYPDPVAGTDDPELYETERWGNFSYAIPVVPGKYSVTLYFAARRIGSGAASSLEGKPQVTRVFSVFCNGRLLLDHFDVSKEARKGDIVVRRFSGLEPNAQGKLLVEFVPVAGYATVTAIEVIQQ